MIDSKGNGASGGVVITDSSNNQVGFSSLSNRLDKWLEGDYND